MANTNDQNGSGDNTSLEEEGLIRKVKKLAKREKKNIHDLYQKQIKDLTNSKEEAEAKAMRALADLQNAQRRMEEEKASFVAFAAQGLVLQVLEIYDNYRRLLDHEPDGLDKEWKKGFELIDQQFQAFMDRHGVKVIAVKVGDPVDPEYHEVVMSGEGEEGKILEVFSPGYEMKGRVLKAVQVKVGKAPLS